MSEGSSSREELEVQAKAITIDKHEEELRLVGQLLNSYSAGFEKLGEFTLIEGNELDYARLLLPHAASTQCVALLTFYRRVITAKL